MDSAAREVACSTSGTSASGGDSGLTALARAYRDEMAVAADPQPALAAIAAVHGAAEALIRNPNEELLLVALLLDLPPLT